MGDASAHGCEGAGLGRREWEDAYGQLDLIKGNARADHHAGHGDLSSLVDESGAHLATQGRFFAAVRSRCVSAPAATREDRIVHELLRTHEMMLRHGATNVVESMAAPVRGPARCIGGAEGAVARSPRQRRLRPPRARVTTRAAILVAGKCGRGRYSAYGSRRGVGDGTRAEVGHRRRGGCGGGCVARCARARAAKTAPTSARWSCGRCQLRIGDCIARSADGPSEGRTFPEVAGCARCTSSSSPGALCGGSSVCEHGLHGKPAKAGGKTTTTATWAWRWSSLGSRGGSSTRTSACATWVMVPGPA